METSWKTVDTVWESSCGKFMGISWKKGSRNPAGKKQKATVAMSWEMHGNVMEHSGHFLGKWNFAEKASSNPAVENQKENRGNVMETRGNFLGIMESSWKVTGKVLERSWTFSGKFLGISWKKPATTQQVNKNQQPWKLHGTRMETSWKIVETVWESSCGNCVGISWKSQQQSSR